MSNCISRKGRDSRESRTSTPTRAFWRPKARRSYRRAVGTGGLLVGENLRDVAFTGQGVIDGNQVFDPQGEEKMRGPHTILLGRGRAVTLRDVTIHKSGNYAFLFFYGQQVWVENAVFEGGWDGVYFCGLPTAWNRDVRVTDCRFFTGDDSIAGEYIEDAVVENSTINSSCNGVRLIGPARRLSFAKCEFYGPGKFEHRTSQRTNMLAGLCLQPSAWDKQPGRWKTCQPAI